MRVLYKPIYLAVFTGKDWTYVGIEVYIVFSAFGVFKAFYKFTSILKAFFLEDLSLPPLKGLFFCLKLPDLCFGGI